MVVEFDRFVGSVSFVWAKYVGRGRWAQSEELTAAAIRLAGDFRGSFYTVWGDGPSHARVPLAKSDSSLCHCVTKSIIL